MIQKHSEHTFRCLHIYEFTLSLQLLLFYIYSVDDNFMPNNSCERISIVYDDHSYNISMSNHRIYIVKLKNVARGGTVFGLANNGSNVVFSENETSGVASILT